MGSLRGRHKYDIRSVGDRERRLRLMLALVLLLSLSAAPLRQPGEESLALSHQGGFYHLQPLRLEETYVLRDRCQGSGSRAHRSLSHQPDGYAHPAVDSTSVRRSDSRAIGEYSHSSLDVAGLQSLLLGYLREEDRLQRSGPALVRESVAGIMGS